MSTRDTLRDRIIEDLDRSSSDNTAVENAIGDAITKYQKTRFYFNESRTVTFNTVDGQRSYTWAGATPDITTEFYRVDQAWITDDTEFELCVANYADLERLNDDATDEDRPEFWAYLGRTLVLHHTPDAVYSVRLAGHIKLAAPANGTETYNAWMTEAFELLRCSAKTFLGMHYFEDLAMASRMKPLELEALRELRGATGDKAGTGYVTPTEF